MGAIAARPASTSVENRTRRDADRGHLRDAEVMKGVLGEERPATADPSDGHRHRCLPGDGNFPELRATVTTGVFCRTLQDLSLDP
jgi:hypothetical protein